MIKLSLCILRSSRPEVFCGKGVLRKLTKQKNTCVRVSFLIKLQALAQVFSCDICQISKNTFLPRTPMVAASVFFCFFPRPQIEGTCTYYISWSDLLCVEYFLMGILYSKICSIVLYNFLRFWIRLFSIKSFKFKHAKDYLSCVFEWVLLWDKISLWYIWKLEVYPYEHSYIDVRSIIQTIVFNLRPWSPSHM